MSISSSRPLALALALALVALMLDRAVLALGEMALRQSSFRYSSLYFGQNGPEIGVFGNSRAVHGVHAPTLSEAVCRPVRNYGYNGLDINAVDALVRDAAERHGGLRVAIIEVTALFSGGRTVAELAPYAGESARLAALTPDEGLVPWRRIVPSLALNSEMFWRAMLYLRHSDQDWINRAGPPKPGVLAAYAARPPRAFVADDQGTETLSALVRDLEAMGVRPVLVVAPYHPIVLENAEPRDWVARLARALDHEILDLSTALSDDRFFADPLHGNIAAADRVAAALAPLLGGCGEPT